MNAEELLPCPFCGGTNTDPEGWMGEHWVSCGTCDASTRMTSTLKTACKAWNRRTPIKPSADTGELRERVLLLRQHEGWLRIRAEGLRDSGSPGDALNAEYADDVADAILDLIQSERGKSMTAQELADDAADAFDNALPDDPSYYDYSRAWKAVGERLFAILSERAEG